MAVWKLKIIQAIHHVQDRAADHKADRRVNQAVRVVHSQAADLRAVQKVDRRADHNQAADHKVHSQVNPVEADHRAVQANKLCPF